VAEVSLDGKEIRVHKVTSAFDCGLVVNPLTVEAQVQSAVAFGLGAALAGGAGALIAPIFSLSPTMGDLPSVQAYVIVVLGGMGSVPGSIIGGILLGVVEGLGVGFYPDANRALAYSNAFGALLLIITLLVRPTGLFGRAD
jgi:branched-chain amino acid transport system permease protein